MKPRRERKKNPKIAMQPICFPTYRPCLDSLPLGRPCAFHPRPVMLNPQYLQTCGMKPERQCVNGDNFIQRTCSDIDTCTRPSPHLYPGEFVEHNGHEYGEEFDDYNENANGFNEPLTPLFSNEQLHNLDNNCGSCRDDSMPSIPMNYLRSDSNTSINNVPDYFTGQQMYQKCPHMQSYMDNNQQQYINNDIPKPPTSSNETTSYTDFTDYAQEVNDRKINTGTETLYNDVRNIGCSAAPDMVCTGNKAPDHSLTALSRSEVSPSNNQTIPNLNKDPPLYLPSTSSQFDRPRTLNNLPQNEDLSSVIKNTSIQCCLPPYGSQSRTKTNTLMKSSNIPRLPSNKVKDTKQVKSTTHRQTADQNEIHNQYRNNSHIKSQMGIERSDPMVNNNMTPRECFSDNSKRRSIYIPPIHISSRNISSNNIQPKSANVATNSKAECCKVASNQMNHINIPQNTLNKNIKIRNDRRNTIPKISKFDNNIPSKRSHSKPVTTQETECGHGISRFKIKMFIDKELQCHLPFLKKSTDVVDCVCDDEIKTQKTVCKKTVTCIHEEGATACASTSCVANVMPGCRCRYPPSFQQFKCVGTLTGSCNCNKSK